MIIILYYNISTTKEAKYINNQTIIYMYTHIYIITCIIKVIYNTYVCNIQ